MQLIRARTGSAIHCGTATTFVDLIQAAQVEQEIGSHSFSHVLYGDPDLSSEAVDADLDACIALASKRGIKLRTFVFPRNSEGHHDALRRHGLRRTEVQSARD